MCILLKGCFVKIFCLDLWCEKKCGEPKNDEKEKDDEPRYVPDPTEIYGEEEIYTGSDCSDFYTEPKSIPIKVVEPSENSIITEHQNSLKASTSLKQISLQGTEMSPEKIDMDDKIYKVTGVVIVDGKEKELKGTLKLMTEETPEEDKTSETQKVSTQIEQKRPDIVPTHQISIHSQNSSTNTDSIGSFPRFSRSYSQDNTSIISGNSETRRFSSYSIPDDEETILKVRKALKRIPIGEISNSSGENQKRISLNRPPLPEMDLTKRPYNTLQYSRRSSHNDRPPISDVSTIFKEIVSKKTLIGKEISLETIVQATNPNLANLSFDGPQEDYNEPYDHRLFRENSRTSRSSSIYNNSTSSKIEEQLYGNDIVHRLNQHVSLPRKSKLLPIQKRPPVPAPRTIFEQEHLYEVII